MNKTQECKICGSTKDVKQFQDGFIKAENYPYRPASVDSWIYRDTDNWALCSECAEWLGLPRK